MSLEAELVGIVTNAIRNHPRTLQTAVGPSQLGTPCARKLAHQLAGTPQRDRGTPWLPTVGHAMHQWMEEVFARDSIDSWTGSRWWVETRVTVGHIDGVQVTGSCDLYDEQTGTVIDWKFVSRSKLTDHRRRGHPGAQYRVQAHLYGRGWQLRGMPINRVAVFFWTRDGQISDRWMWHEPFDEQVAVDALARATNTAQLIRLLGPEIALNVQPMVDDYCSHCPYLDPAGGPTARGCPGMLNPPTPTTLAQHLGTNQ